MGSNVESLFTATNHDGSLMSIEEIKLESFVIMVAGSDTSAAFISPFVNNIIQDPEIYAKLVQEIHSFELAGKLSLPVATFEETNKMEYFIACVKETLRFSAPVPFIYPRYVSKGGMKINGIWVPEGTEIGANPYVIHRDSATFGADAHVFRPERWLDNEEGAKQMDKYLLSWGYGSRVCLGKNIAQMITQKLCLQVSPHHCLPRFSDTDRRGVPVVPQLSLPVGPSHKALALRKSGHYAILGSMGFHRRPIKETRAWWCSNKGSEPLNGDSELGKRYQTQSQIAGKGWDSFSPALS